MGKHPTDGDSAQFETGQTKRETIHIRQASNARGLATLVGLATERMFGYTGPSTLAVSGRKLETDGSAARNVSLPHLGDSGLDRQLRRSPRLDPGRNRRGHRPLDSPDADARVARRPSVPGAPHGRAGRRPDPPG